MKLEQENILFFTRTMELGGTENVVLQLCEILKTKVNSIVVCSCGGINVLKLEQMGIKHYEIGDIQNKSPKVVISVLKKVSKIIKNENITVIHTHHRMAAFYSNILSYVYKFKFINTSHNTFNDKKILTRFSYNKAYLVACGEVVKENLVNFYGIDEERVTVIHNAVRPFNGELKEIDILKQYRNEGYFLIGNIGRLSKQKGFEYYIKAVSNVLKEFNKVKFFIIGSGEEKENIEKLVKEMNLSNDVIFMGYRNDIQNVMSQLDLIVLTSLWEGLPLTPIEAFSVGKTIVATAVDGTIEIVDDEVDGFLVEAKNEKEIAWKIGDLIKNTKKREMFEKNCKIKYSKKFSIDTFEKKYKEYYSKLYI